MRTLISFPNHVAELSGVYALEVGALFVKVFRVGAFPARVLRSKFKPEELADTGHNLAFRARQIVEAL